MSRHAKNLAQVASGEHRERDAERAGGEHVVSGVYAVAPVAPVAEAPWSEFATHDAKNMLGVLTSNIAYLRDAVARRADHDEIAAAVEDLETCSRRLTDIVHEAMQPSVKRASGIAPRLSTVNVSAVLHSVYQQVRRQAQAADVGIQVRIVSDAETQLDRSLIERVLVNLVDNSLRFAPPGSSVGIACDVVDDRVALVVSDDGPGVDRCQSERIFEPYFTTGNDAFAEDAPHSGLGLAFCRAVARAHGGDVRVGAASHGGCFVVELPLIRA